jgi:hypothetical protein
MKISRRMNRAGATVPAETGKRTAACAVRLKHDKTQQKSAENLSFKSY